jgi:hypothetical protein
MDEFNLKHYIPDPEHHKITGFWTVAEHIAYELGQEHMAETYNKFIEDWDGSTNNAAGQQLYDIALIASLAPPGTLEP